MVAAPLQTIYRTANNFYPTPASLVTRMLERVEINQGDILLEPSAGLGHIAEILRRSHPDNQLRLVEVHPVLQAELRRKDFRVFAGSLFDFHEPVDVAVMNPPFCEDFQDIDHFMHVWRLLKPGGRMASILHEFSGFPRHQSGKPALFGKFLHAIGARRIMNPPGSFSTADRPTQTSTCIIWATKP